MPFSQRCGVPGGRGTGSFDGAMPGTKTLQYQIRKAPGQTLIMTATAAASNLTRMLGEFEKMVTSMRMP